MPPVSARRNKDLRTGTWAPATPRDNSDGMSLGTPPLPSVSAARRTASVSPRRLGSLSPRAAAPFGGGATSSPRQRSVAATTIAASMPRGCGPGPHDVTPQHGAFVGTASQRTKDELHKATVHAPHAYQSIPPPPPLPRGAHQPRHRRASLDALTAAQREERRAVAALDDFAFGGADASSDGAAAAERATPPLLPTSRRTVDPLVMLHGDKPSAATLGAIKLAQEHQRHYQQQSSASLQHGFSPNNTAGGGRQTPGQHKGPRGARFDVHPLPGLIVGTSPPELLNRYRAFLGTTLQPLAATLTSLPDAAKVSFADLSATLDEDPAAAHAVMLEEGSTYSGPFLDPPMQHALLTALAHVPRTTLSEDYAVDVMHAVATYQTSTAMNSFANRPADPLALLAKSSGKRASDAAAAAGGDAKDGGGSVPTKELTTPRHAPQHHAGLGNFRFAHLFAVACDLTQSPLVLRNVAFFIRCFDPTSVGKVPQHVLVCAPFLRKYAERHVWHGVLPLWLRIAAAFEHVQDIAAAERGRFARAVPEGDALDDFHAFTWAVETFAGQHDKIRDTPGAALSQQLFGVPYVDVRAVIFGTPELLEAFSVDDIRYNRQTKGPQ